MKGTAQKKLARSELQKTKQSPRHPQTRLIILTAQTKIPDPIVVPIQNKQGGNKITAEKLTVVSVKLEKQTGQL